MVFIMLVLTVGLSGCSIQNKMIRTYKGKTEKELIQEMGKPRRIEKNVGGWKIDVYLKVKALKAAMINTGQFQYDRFESPRSIKTETFKFYLNPSGVIENVTYEISYER